MADPAGEGSERAARATTADDHWPYPGVLRPCRLDDHGSATLDPDLVVHRTLGRDQRLPDPPVLCVDIGAGPADLRPGCSYARLGVDHHWHLDSHHETLQVSVRVDDAYRHCETFSAENLTPRVGARGPAWVDFGVGIAHLDGLLPVPLEAALLG